MDRAFAGGPAARYLALPLDSAPHELLPLFVGQALVDEILEGGRRFNKPALGQAFMPVEFQGACYRFGHSMVRPSYRANLKGDSGEAFFGMIFDPAADGQGDPSTCVEVSEPRAASSAGRRSSTSRTARSSPISASTHVSPHPLQPAAGSNLHARSTAGVPQRNLLRGVTWSLPSGQAIAAGLTPRP